MGDKKDIETDVARRVQLARCGRLLVGRVDLVNGRLRPQSTPGRGRKPSAAR